MTKAEMNHALREQTDEISSILETFMQRVDDRFTKAEADIQDIKQSIHNLTTTIDGFI